MLFLKIQKSEKQKTHVNFTHESQCDIFLCCSVFWLFYLFFFFGFLGFSIMGKDISILNIANDQAQEMAAYSLSGNFGRERDYFSVESLDKMKVIDAITIIEKCTSKLAQEGFSKGTPDLTNQSWAWGVTEKDNVSVLMEQKDLVGVLLFHLAQILSRLKQYPQGYVIIDFSTAEDYDLGNGITIRPQKSQEEQDMESRWSTFYRHPTKGQMKITTYEELMEVYGVEKALGHDERAEVWMNLAQKNFGK